MKINKQVAYFIGVLHSDGCIYRFQDKKKNCLQIRLNLTVAEKSLPMANAFQKILLENFNRTVNVRKIPNKNSFAIQTSINRLYGIFSRWENNRIPKVIQKNEDLFGAYLAGIIDGDGYVKYKKSKGVIFACQVKIAANKPLEELASLIKLYLNCGVHYEKDKNKLGTGFNTCFLISSKTYQYILNKVEPYVTIPYKKKRIVSYCSKWL